MKEKVICGIQQVGVGVADVMTAWKWYHDNFGFDVKIVDDEGVAERMLPYTGGKPQPRRALLVFNLQGGGGLEIWQPKGRKLNYLDKPANLGDYGIFACKLKSKNVQKAYDKFVENKVKCLSAPMMSPNGTPHFFVEDPYGNIFDIEQDDYVFVDDNKITGGVNGIIAGVSDMDKSIDFYGRILGYDVVVYDQTDVFSDFANLPYGTDKVRRVRLARSRKPEGPLSDIMGTSYIELVQNMTSTCRRLYENRFWGDPGYIQICFDVRNMPSLEKEVAAAGHPFVCDSGSDFGMGDADGWFTYIEDPDGTLIEFVETRKIPIIKRLGIYLNLTRRDDRKPLPRFITKMLRLMRS